MEAAAGLPVQEIVRRSGTTLLVSWVSGIPILDALRADAERADDLGA